MFIPVAKHSVNVLRPPQDLGLGNGEKSPKRCLPWGAHRPMAQTPGSSRQRDKSHGAPSMPLDWAWRRVQWEGGSGTREGRKEGWEPLWGWDLWVSS